MLKTFFTENMSHDLFRYRALSKNGLKLFEYTLKNSGLTIVEMSIQTGINIKTVRRKIKKMVTAGLVAPDFKKRCARFHVINFTDLDRAAQILGTAGNYERDKKRYRKEREAFKKYKEAIKSQSKNSSNELKQ